MALGVEMAGREVSCGGNTSELRKKDKFCVSTDLQACIEMENICHLSRKILLYRFYITVFKRGNQRPEVPPENNITFLIKIPKCTYSLPDNNPGKTKQQGLTLVDLIPVGILNVNNIHFTNSLSLLVADSCLQNATGALEKWNTTLHSYFTYSNIIILNYNIQYLLNRTVRGFR